MIHLEPGENLVGEIRKHWLVIALEAFVLALLAIAPYFVYAVIDWPALIELAAQNSGSSAMVAFVSLFAQSSTLLYSWWLLFLWIIFFVKWTDYYLDVWYLTSRKVIDVEQKGLFHRDEAVLRLQDLQDVTIESRGLIATLFHFGDIRLQTAGERREFLIRSAAAPEDAKHRLLALQAAIRGSNQS